MILRSNSSSSTAAAMALPSLTYSKAASFAELIPRYDAFILDQFGALLVPPSCTRYGQPTACLAWRIGFLSPPPSNA